MARVTGIGGAFLRAKDPEALYAWYEKHLGLMRLKGSWMFDPEDQRGPVVVALFKRESDYFPVSQPAMLNFQVDDVNALLDQLIAAGVEVDSKRETYPYGSFGWFTDPEGYPAIVPPWGTLSAIDMNTGQYLWHFPLGYYPELAAKGHAEGRLRDALRQRSMAPRSGPATAADAPRSWASSGRMPASSARQAAQSASCSETR